MDSCEMLRLLCLQEGPSGFESRVAQVAKTLLEPLVDQVWIDRMGNLVGLRRCGRPGAGKLLLDAHLDEIGLVVTGVKDGLLRFAAIGGVDPRMLPDRELTILTHPPRFGVVACLPPHVLTDAEREKAPAIDELYVDVGLSQQQAQREIPVGTPMVFRPSFLRLGQRQVCGKAMDDRSCFVALLRTAQLLRAQPLDVDVYFLGSVREETSSAGAITAVQALEPDWCVAVDVTHGSTPDSPKDQSFTLGSGPAVGIGPNMTRWMSRRLLDQAQALGIPVQQEVMGGSSGTNAWKMQICNEGVATAVLSLPLKYMHTPVEVVDLDDLEHTARLLAAFAQGLGEEGARDD